MIVGQDDCGVNGGNAEIDYGALVSAGRAWMSLSGHDVLRSTSYVSRFTFTCLKEGIDIAGGMF